MAPAASQRVCVEGSCGNGVLDAEEGCDDGNLIDGDGCSADCQSAEVCGNAIVDHAVGELCDDGNTSSGDACCGDCRSCPELAVPRDTEVIAVDIEPIDIEEAPGPSAFAMEGSLEPYHCRPEPLVISPQVRPPLLDEMRLEMTEEVVSPWGRAELANAQRRAKSERRARRRLVQAQAILNEELLRAHDTINQLEQINAELHQYIAGDCQRLPSGRGIALH